MIILGIDPGLATVGFGVIEADRGRYTVLDYGIISTPKEDTERYYLAARAVKEEL